MRIAIIVPDNRDEFGRYADQEPFFGPAPTALLEGFKEFPECEIHVVCCVKRPMPAPRQLARNIYFHSAVVPQWGWFRGAYCGCIAAIRKLLRDVRPDIVHGQGTERYCALAAVYSGFPNVLTIHGNMVKMVKFAQGRQKLFLQVTAWMETHALRKTFGVFCNSRFTEQVVAPRTLVTWRVPNALQPNYFNPLPPPAHNNWAVLLNVGVIAPHKRQLELLRMASDLNCRGTRFQIRFIGALSKTPYATQFMEEIAAAKAKGYVDYLGAKSEDEVAKAYDNASALIHCPAEESFGLVVAEALARNLKLFGFRVGGVGDVAEGVEGAELLENEDWSGLQAAIANWINSGASRPTEAATQIKARFSPKKIAESHLRIYGEVLARKDKPS